MNIQFIHLFEDGALAGERRPSIHKLVHAFVGARMFSLRFSRKVIMQNVSFQIQAFYSAVSQKLSSVGMNA